MKTRAVGYWICTVLIALSFLSGGVAYLLRVPLTGEVLSKGVDRLPGGRFGVSDGIRV